MKLWIALTLINFATGASAQNCRCDVLKWATCEGPPCTCTILVEKNRKQVVDCNSLIPKCLVMKAEMYRVRKRIPIIVTRPVMTIFVENDGLYDPDCESDGSFKARQCNDAKECWCVNSAGLRRTNKGDMSLKCEKLVDTYWVRLIMTHEKVDAKLDKDILKIAIAQAIQSRYNFSKDLVKEIQYDPDARLIFADIQKQMGDRQTDLPRLAYYIEKDAKMLTLSTKKTVFELMVEGQKMEMENILLHYVDEEGSTITMKKPLKEIIAVVAVVVLALLLGLLAVLYPERRRKLQYFRLKHNSSIRKLGQDEDGPRNDVTQRWLDNHQPE